MGYLFLILAIIAFLALEWVLDNILWIGAIFILLLIISIIRAASYYKDTGFDFYDFLMLGIKIVGIIGMIILIRTVN